MMFVKLFCGIASFIVGVNIALYVGKMHPGIALLVLGGWLLGVMSVLLLWWSFQDADQQDTSRSYCDRVR